MTEISPNQTLRSFCYADRHFARKANLRLRVSHCSKSINITAGQTASHLILLILLLASAVQPCTPIAYKTTGINMLLDLPLGFWNLNTGVGITMLKSGLFHTS